jgi:deoxyribonuclease V
MHFENLHPWNVSIDQAVRIQNDLAKKVILHDGIVSPELIAGVDVSIRGANEATAVAILLDYPGLKVVQTSVVKGTADFPYIPGLLSFREVPLILKACEKLTSAPDLVLVDGQGIAHPRRIGLASHLGLFLNIPTIGCAKSPLYGKFQEPGSSPGDYSMITDADGNIIGAVLRTRLNVKPLYISVGHKTDLASAIDWVMKCCRGYRLPEPTRLAHLASKGKLW